ncbi:MAG TPA: carboxypeptidase-like regulatory domain-containing protein, partial [Bryobacteraceae bacterium]|nr:carboxypeptidase-like regulatory domain-containing protein [Bryobacteraceae bacterium]
MKLHAACITLANLCAGCLPIRAQQTGVTGRGTEPSNLLVGNVAVTATSQDGSRFRTLTAGNGLHQFPALRASTYVLRFEAPGFAPAERTVSLLVGQVLNADITLQLATISSAVNVESTVADVDSSSSTVAGDVSPAEVKKLPLNGRNYLQFVMLVSGITSNDVTNS